MLYIHLYAHMYIYMIILFESNSKDYQETIKINKMYQSYSIQKSMHINQLHHSSLRPNYLIKKLGTINTLIITQECKSKKSLGKPNAHISLITGKLLQNLPSLKTFPFKQPIPLHHNIACHPTTTTTLWSFCNWTFCVFVFSCQIQWTISSLMP